MTRHHPPGQIWAQLPFYWAMVTSLWFRWAVSYGQRWLPRPQRHDLLALGQATHQQCEQRRRKVSLLWECLNGRKQFMLVGSDPDLIQIQVAVGFSKGFPCVTCALPGTIPSHQILPEPEEFLFPFNRWKERLWGVRKLPGKRWSQALSPDMSPQV